MADERAGLGRGVVPILNRMAYRIRRRWGPLTDQDVLRRVPQPPQWIGTSEVRAAVDGRFAAASVYARLANLQRRGLIRARWVDDVRTSREFQLTDQGFWYWMGLEFGGDA